MRIGAYHFAAFVSAFLLFQVQPMVAKAILPVFGGSYLVWGACMVFFQAVLLLGYAYAHWMQSRFGVARYARWHGLLLLVPFAFFPFEFESMAAAGQGMPLVVGVSRLLLAAVSVPFFALSTTSLVLQRWLSVSDLPQRDNPYVLYAASNLGSMCALLTYPVLVEPFMGPRAQGVAWWCAYGAMILAHVVCRPRGTAEREEGAARSRVGPFNALRWLLLSAAASAALLATTNSITFDVASVPLLWVVPLAVYLLAFVLAFRRGGGCPGWASGLFYWAVPAGMLLYLTAQLRLSVPPPISIPLHVGILFVVCMNCVGRLVDCRPAEASRLTGFYMLMAVGGLAGSLLVGWILPPISRSLVEVPLALCLAAAGTALCSSGRGRGAGWAEAAGVSCAVAAVTLLPWLVGRAADGTGGAKWTLVISALPLALVLRWAARRPWFCASALLALAVAMNWTEDLAMGGRAVRTLRNFYGIYKVYDSGGLRYLQHGTTQHGRQYLSGDRSATPLAYYHPTTPLGRLLRSPHFRFPRIAMIGLGTGAVAAYPGPGDRLTIYELDSDNLDVADGCFSYLGQARRRGVELRFVFGDGRVSLGREEADRFDLLIVDAFSSGSIPAHLLTVEAFEEYVRVLRPGGLLLLHVSNKVLDLEPVVYANARALGLGACEASNETDTHPDAETTYWMAVSAGEDTLSRLRAALAWVNGSSASPAVRPWRDRYSDIPGAMMRQWGRGVRSGQGKKYSPIPGVTASPASIFRTSSA